MSADINLAALPAPFVPPEVDLRGFPFMPIEIQRLLDSEFYAKATGEEFKAAFTLWCKAFLQTPAGSLPDDDRVLAKLSGADGRWRKLRAVALHGFVRCSDGRLYHPVVAEKAMWGWRKRISQRNRVAKRWGKEEETYHGITAAHSPAVPERSPGSTRAESKLYQGDTKGSEVKGSEGMGGDAVPPPSPTTSSSSASSERARARASSAESGNGDGKKEGDLPANNSNRKLRLAENGEWEGLSEAQRLRWQEMFDNLSIPDMLRDAAVWLLAHPQERAAYTAEEDGLSAYISRWLIRESKPKRAPVGN